MTIRGASEHAAGRQLPGEVFDDLTRLAAQLCGTPMALVSLADGDRERFASGFGVVLGPESREGLCSPTVGGADVLVVRDACADPRFAANPLVTGEPWIRFYAGAALTGADARRLGTLCVLDTVPRGLTALQADQLLVLAAQVTAQLTLRRHAAQLAASQQLLQGVLDHTDAIIYVKDLAGRFTLANQAFHALMGIEPGGIVGSDNERLFGAASAGELGRNDRSIAASGGRAVFAESVTGADGVARDFLSTKFALRDADGVVYGVAGVSADVTEMAEQRRLLAESEQRWRALVECSPVAVTVVGADGSFLYANPAAVSLYGADDLADVVGRPALDLIAPGQEKPTVRGFAQVYHGEELLGRRWQLVRIDGRLVDLEFNAAAVDYRGQRAVQIEFRDVTTQVRYEEALRESERRWRSLFEGSPVGIGVADEEGRIVQANAALCALCGREAEDVIGHLSMELVHPDDRASREDNERLLDATGGVARVERRVVRPDGQIRWAWITFSHTAGPAGETWTIAHAQDLTERKAAEAALAASEDSLRAVAHVAQQIQTGGDARQTVVDAALRLADAACVSLLEADSGLAALRLTASTDPRLLDILVDIDGPTAIAATYRSGESLFLADPAHDRRVSPALLALTDARSVYILAVPAAEVTTGVLVVGWNHRLDDLDDSRAAIITLLADQTGAALHQSGLLTRLELLSVTDSLTGLPNRRGWDDLLARSLSEAAARTLPLTVALADLDHFKQFNDTHGHAAGDELLRWVGASLRSVLRHGDMAGRWGGEEFAIVLPNCSAAKAPVVLERLLHGLPHGQTCSIGHATWNRVEGSDALMARADRSLYVAKTGGRNQICPR